MTDLFAARAQMAMSLGFHIVFAVIGIAMPLFMVIAEARWLFRRDAVFAEAREFRFQGFLHFRFIVRRERGVRKHSARAHEERIGRGHRICQALLFANGIEEDAFLMYGNHIAIPRKITL